MQVNLGIDKGDFLDVDPAREEGQPFDRSAQFAGLDHVGAVEPLRVGHRNAANAGRDSGEDRDFDVACQGHLALQRVSGGLFDLVAVNILRHEEGNHKRGHHKQADNACDNEQYPFHGAVLFAAKLSDNCIM